MISPERKILDLSSLRSCDIRIETVTTVALMFLCALCLDKWVSHNDFYYTLIDRHGSPWRSLISIMGYSDNIVEESCWSTDFSSYLSACNTLCPSKATLLGHAGDRHYVQLRSVCDPIGTRSLLRHHQGLGGDVIHAFKSI